METLLIVLLSLLAGLLVGGLLMRRAAGAAGPNDYRELQRRTAALEDELRRLDEQEKATRRILASMGDGVLLLDDRGVVLEANPAAATLLTVTPDRLVGQPLVQSARSFTALPLLDRALAEGAVRDMVDLPGSRTLSVQALPLEGDVAGRGLQQGGSRRVLFLLRDETNRLRTDRLRRDFVANVSHELKTPLARLSLLASTLRHAVAENPDQSSRLIDSLGAEVSRLGTLVSDLLTLSEVEEAGLEAAEGGKKPALDHRMLDLSQVATGAAAALRPAFEEAGITLSLSLEPAPVRGDPIYLETAARNLLDNARRYSDRGGRVRLSVATRQESAVLVVEDDGSGIPRDDQDRIFERFYRVDPARSRDTGGTGLGLSIVRHIVEQHGGRVTVRSRVGVGSIFTVTLPRATPAE